MQSSASTCLASSPLPKNHAKLISSPPNRRLHPPSAHPLIFSAASPAPEKPRCQTRRDVDLLRLLCLKSSFRASHLDLRSSVPLTYISSMMAQSCLRGPGTVLPDALPRLWTQGRRLRSRPGTRRSGSCHVGEYHRHSPLLSTPAQVTHQHTARTIYTALPKMQCGLS